MAGPKPATTADPAAVTTAAATSVNATLTAINATVNGTAVTNTTSLSIGGNCTLGNGICSSGLVCDTSRAVPSCINIVALNGTCDTFHVCLNGDDSLFCLEGKCQVRPNVLVVDVDGKERGNGNGRKHKKKKHQDDSK